MERIENSIIVQNVLLFIDLLNNSLPSGLNFTYTALAKEIEFSISYITRVLKGEKEPSKRFLLSLSIFMSEILKIPFSEFDRGQILLSKEFSKILKSKLEHKKYEGKLEISEIEFIFNLREMVNDKQIPLRTSTISRILAVLSRMGVDSEEQTKYLQAKDMLSHRNES